MLWKLPIQITISGHVTFRAKTYEKALEEARRIQSLGVPIPHIEEVKVRYEMKIEEMEGE